MILSSILLATAYYGLQLVQQYYYHFDLRNTRTLQHQALYSRLQRDFDQAVYVTQEGATVICHQQYQTVQYEFQEESIVRTQAGLIEIFDISVQDRQCAFLQNPGEGQDLWVYELTFALQQEDELLSFRISKVYAADLLMQLTSESWPD